MIVLPTAKQVREEQQRNMEAWEQSWNVVKDYYLGLAADSIYQANSDGEEYCRVKLPKSTILRKKLIVKFLLRDLKKAGFDAHESSYRRFGSKKRVNRAVFIDWSVEEDEAKVFTTPPEVMEQGEPV